MYLPEISIEFIDGWMIPCLASISTGTELYRLPIEILHLLLELSTEVVLKSLLSLAALPPSCIYFSCF